MAAKRETSVEPRVEEKAIGWLRKYSIQYWLKTESMNSEIDNALKEALSKLGGSGGNVPDLKCFIDYHGRKIPVMIEAKGYKSFLEKLNDMGEVDNYTKKGLPNHQNINKYAVNGAIHYATAIINGTESYKEVIAIGITGWGDPKKIETALKVYYVSDENYNVPKQVGEYEDLSFLSDSELPDFIEKIDSLYLTEEEREMLTQKLETQIETNLKKLNQEMRDTYSISETYRVKLISGMIIAGLGVIENGKTIVSPLEIDELRSKEDKRSHDGVIIMNTISSYLESKDIPSEKVELIKTNFEQVFIQTDLYKQYQPGESRLKKVYITVKKDIIPFFAKKKYHLDFTGKLFNVLNDWVKIPDGDQNDVVLTPRYVCDLNKEYKEYKITDIFNIVNTHSILQSQINENSGGTPYLTAAEGNNSVSTYISCDDKWIDEGNCIFIGGKTMTITYQEKDFFSNDSHNLALYLKDNSKRNKYIQCFFITALKKSLGTKYYWGDSISKKKIQNDTVFLPINDKMEIDYDYMKSYIKVIEKIVISDVVKYKDSLNTASDITSD